MAAVADVVMDAYAVDSMVTRTRQSASATGLDPVKVAMTRPGRRTPSPGAASGPGAACAPPARGALEKHLAAIAPLFAFRPFDPAALRETVVLAAEERAVPPSRSPEAGARQRARLRTTLGVCAS
jgi:hypothetical protein